MTNREWLSNKIQNMGDREFADTLACCSYIDNCYDELCIECKTKWLKNKHKGGMELSEEEKIILRSLHGKYKWIARDKNKELFVFSEKAVKDLQNGVWEVTTDTHWLHSLDIKDGYFKGIQWEDEEPYNILDLINANE